jgi:hypothetical protein
MIRDAAKSGYLEYFVRPRACIKDPFALFSSSFFAEKFGAKVVTVVRHPAAYVSSIIKAGWSFDFTNWRSQKALLRDHLEPFVKEIEQFSHSPPSLLKQACLLWRATHFSIHRMHQMNPTWLLYRHEDLARDPYEGFSSIFRKLGLSLTPNVKSYIQESTNSDNPMDPPNASSHDVARDSIELAKVWKQRLSSHEINDIRSYTEDVWPFFYRNVDW